MRAPGQRPLGLLKCLIGDQQRAATVRLIRYRRHVYAKRGPRSNATLGSTTTRVRISLNQRPNDTTITKWDLSATRLTKTEGPVCRKQEGVFVELGDAVPEATGFCAFGLEHRRNSDRRSEDWVVQGWESSAG